MFQHILVPLDGSALAEEALPTAAHLARTTGATLFLLRVVAPSLAYISTYPHPLDSVAHVEQMRERARTEALDYLSHVVLTEHLDDIHPRLEVQEGTPVPGILQFAQSQQIDLVVMRSHGETGIRRWISGSVAQGIVRRNSKPGREQTPSLLIIRDTGAAVIIRQRELQHTIRILVPLDGTPFAESALQPAAQLVAALASPGAGAIHLTRTVHYLHEGRNQQKEHVEKANKEARTVAETYLKNIKQRFYNGDLAQFHLQVTSSVVAHYDNAEIWKRVIEESECVGDIPGYSGCDIIAMVTHSRHGLQHFLQGSVTENVLDASAHPLLVIHGQSEKTEEEEIVAGSADILH